VKILFIRLLSPVISTNSVYNMYTVVLVDHMVVSKYTIVADLILAGTFHFEHYLSCMCTILLLLKPNLYPHIFYF